MAKGYGDLLSKAFNESGLSPEELAKRLHRKSKSLLYRIFSEDQEPTAEDVNILARELDLSTEAILLAMGIRFNPPEAALLEHDLVALLLQLNRAERRAVKAAALGQLELRRLEGRQP